MSSYASLPVHQHCDCYARLVRRCFSLQCAQLQAAECGPAYCAAVCHFKYRVPTLLMLVIPIIVMHFFHIAASNGMASAADCQRDLKQGAQMLTWHSYACGAVCLQTSDGRVVFMLPFQNHTIVGTTDHGCEVRGLWHLVM